MSWWKTVWLDHRRKSALSKATNPHMRDFLAHALANPDDQITDLEIVALDLETTGLDPAKDQILSIGLVPLSRGSVTLGGSWHRIVQIDRAIPASSAVIHGITDDQAASGEPLETLLPQLLEILAGKAILVHYSPIERHFLDAACRKLYGSPFITQVIDTLPLARRLLRMRNHMIQPGNLRLFNLRPLFGLPQYQAHNALYDAIATAELFMAILSELSPANDYKLKDVML